MVNNVLVNDVLANNVLVHNEYVQELYFDSYRENECCEELSSNDFNVYVENNAVHDDYFQIHFVLEIILLERKNLKSYWIIYVFEYEVEDFVGLD